MAIGLGLMLGFTFPKNFDAPYKSESITDFWRTWHISLSSWLRDYLYIPLGGNRRGQSRTYVNLALVMLLGGLWHGASWNFVIWGAIHGGMLALERYRGKTTYYTSLPKFIRVVTTFLLILITWVFFRSNNLSHAITHLRSMFSSVNVPESTDLIAGILYQPYYLLTMCVAGIIIWSCPQTWEWTQRLTPIRMGICLILFFNSLAVMSTQTYNPFILFHILNMRNLTDYRRETAKKDLENTHIKQNVCIISLVIFCMIILSVPICQFTSEILNRKFPQVFQVSEFVSNPRREAFEKYEDTLEEESVLTNWLLPHIQVIFTSLFNIGNEQVYIGNNGWLFYRADIDAVIGINDNSTRNKYDDALNAILDFKKQVEVRNIALIVLPIPVKPTIYPEHFSTRYTKVNIPHYKIHPIRNLLKNLHHKV